MSVSTASVALTGTASSEYENLGSAIYQVGVTSVATESEILDMGSQIAARI